MDGVLLIDKPSGPTSHDVVARMRRALQVRRIGHTGTLDPLASGLLPLVIGRATRLASLLTGSDKTYEATIRLGYGTDTDDAQGSPTGPAADTLPSDSEIEAVLENFRGTFEQVPPSHSAKKIGGARAYELARDRQPVVLAPVKVTVRALEWLGRAGETVDIRVQATAGFYVRGLARDIGARLGCGAHITALRRIGSGWFEIGDAMPLVEAERLGLGVADRLLSPAAALPAVPAVTMTPTGLERSLHGQAVEAAHLTDAFVARDTESLVRLLAADGRLVALARQRGDALHPVVVLG
ncbi:MAG: tRNA pseudouridine(55) synthase TruB [Vicinamibacterales bacterium]